ncbi:class GN sortase [Colwellia sp. PAMC 21821]|uniref:class GN sortase n=1 Tax=Colwellia sp. PAMC 21821 TaxID=1816219 RepID=UPI0009BE1B1B|nr:class GN sortase [Colwellia sp. PAMC 21821]ARD45206.1 hypothetical protein A3Q33_13365 [Colwellia sp. PAMC 21821]
MAKLIKTARKLSASALVIVGALLCIQASWLPLKAWLSQQLINHSWQQSMAAQKHLQAQQQNHAQDNSRPHNLNSYNLNSYNLTKQIAIKPWPWADTYPIAELVFQRLDKSIVVLNGGDPTTLAFSAGAVAPFNQPNVTKPFVVAGHRDSHFAFLEDVTIRDIISLTDAQGQAQLFKVASIDIVDASAGQLSLIDNEQSLILITCYPFAGIGNDSDERYVITANRL